MPNHIVDLTYCAFGVAQRIPTILEQGRRRDGQRGRAKICYTSEIVLGNSRERHARPKVRARFALDETNIHKRAS